MEVTGLLSHFNYTLTDEIEVVRKIILFDHYLILLEVLHGRQRSKLKNETLIILMNELRLDDPVLNLKVLHSVGNAFVEIFIYLVVMDILAGLQCQIIVQNIQLNFFREL